MNKTNKISRPGRGSADPKKGAVLLIAILVSSVALAVGFGVYNRTYKELLMVSFWKQTQAAFSAADTGLECALYADTRAIRPSIASCLGNSILGWNPLLNASGSFTISSPICVTVDITKNLVYPFTTIKSRGYNTCDTNSNRRVERGLRVDY